MEIHWLVPRKIRIQIIFTIRAHCQFLRPARLFRCNNKVCRRVSSFSSIRSCVEELPNVWVLWTVPDCFLCTAGTAGNRSCCAISRASPFPLMCRWFRCLSRQFFPRSTRQMEAFRWTANSRRTHRWRSEKWNLKLKLISEFYTWLLSADGGCLFYVLNLNGAENEFGLIIYRQHIHFR